MGDVVKTMLKKLAFPSPPPIPNICWSAYIQHLGQWAKGPMGANFHSAVTNKHIKMLPDYTGTSSIDDTGYKHGFSKGNTSDKSFITNRNNFAETKATSRLCSIP